MWNMVEKVVHHGTAKMRVKQQSPLCGLKIIGQRPRRKKQ